MKTKLAIKRAGSGAELARILGVTRQALTIWKPNLPPLRVYQLKERRPEWFPVNEPKKLEGKS